MILNTLGALAIAISLGAPNDQVHPAFIKTPDQFAKAWEKGEADGKRKAKLDSMINRFRKGIGSIRVNGFGSKEVVSWAWLIPAEYSAYYEAYQGIRQFKSADEMGPKREVALPKVPVTLQSLFFYGEISLYPSFGGPYGLVDRTANPNDLNDVRVVLSAGGRIIQPVTQPGNMLQTKSRELNLFTIPRYTYSTTNSSASGYASGSGGYAYGSASGTSTTTTSYVEHAAEGYNWYQGEFIAEFKLFDKDGQPLIRPEDKEVQLIVIYGNNERRATYKLADLMNPIK